MEARRSVIVEMRTYRTKPGTRDEFLRIFRSKSIPAHLTPSREPMTAQFSEGELWKKELEGVLMPMLEKYEVVLVEDPDERIQS
jgi:hypothetical protein